MVESLRYNKDKLRVDLIPALWTRSLAIVLTFGAAKYGDRNWENSINGKEHDSFRDGCVASLKRHLLSLSEGQIIDPESKQHHGVHIAWNALAIVSYDTAKGLAISLPDITYTTNSYEETCGRLP